MKCTDALLMLLDADLGALSADRASPLGRHVSGCAQCRAVVGRLQADTSHLASLAAARPAPAALRTRMIRRRAIWLAPIPLAAAVVLAYIGLSRAPANVARTAESSARVAASPPRTPVPDPATTPDPAGASPAARVASRVSHGSALRTAPQLPSMDATDVPDGRRSSPTRIDVGGPTLVRPVTPTPVAYDADFAGAELALVDVSTAGGRVLVLRPSNSNITVVWFY